MLLLLLWLTHLKASLVNESPLTGKLKQFEYVNIRHSSLQSQGGQEYHDSIDMHFTYKSTSYQVKLKKSDIFHPDYSEYKIDADGEIISESKIPNCFYQGKVHGDSESRVFGHFCGGSFDGTVHAHEKQIIVSPAHKHLKGPAPSSHVAFEAHHLQNPEKPGRCALGDSHHGAVDVLSEEQDASRSPSKPSHAHQPRPHDHVRSLQAAQHSGNHQGHKLQLVGNQIKYVELVVFNDAQRYRQFGEDVHLLSADIINGANALFNGPSATFAYDINIRLVRQYTNAVRDPWTVPADCPLNNGCAPGEKNSTELLNNFNAYASGRSWLNPPAVDHVQLLTGLDLEEQVLGTASLIVMCVQNKSFSLVQATSSLLDRNAALSAHQIGHTLGMFHDNLAAGPVNFTLATVCVRDNHIMYPITNATAPTTWSPCSVVYLDSFFDGYSGPTGSLLGPYATLSISDRCLENAPSSAQIWTNTPVCGDGKREGSEACDCPNRNCQGVDPCCNGTSCTLLPGARCSAYDSCCNSQTCQVHANTRTCRAARDPVCDFEEKCDGVSPICPGDAYAAHTTSCNNIGLCYTGLCRSADLQCQSFVDSSLNPIYASRCLSDPATLCKGLLCQYTTTVCHNNFLDEFGFLIMQDVGSPCDVASHCVNETCQLLNATTAFWWNIGSYSTCSKTCGSGVQVRTVECKIYGGTQTVADQYCPGPIPDRSVVCNSQPCATFFTGTWSACPDLCSGSRSRVVECRSDTSQTLNDSVCFDLGLTKPISSENCSCGWLVQPGSCSVPCGGGTLTTAPACATLYLNNNGQYVTVEPINCEGVQLPPTSCNTQQCQVYVWETLSYSSCNQPCGGGDQTRVINCVNRTEGSNNQTVADSFCSNGVGYPPAGPKPASIRPCNTFACPTYDWVLVSTGACNATCGGGLASQTYNCTMTEYETGSPVTTVVTPTSSNCQYTPSPWIPCNTQQCELYQWEVPDWDSCSVLPCSGTRSRVGTCRKLDKTVEDLSSRCSDRPPTFTLQPCSCDPYLELYEPANNSAIRAGSKVWLRWIASAAFGSELQLLISDPSWQWRRYIARSVPNNSPAGEYLWTIPKDFAAGSYSIYLKVNDATQVHTNIVIKSACENVYCYKSAITGDKCVAGECVCDPQWEGANCLQSKCKRLNCRNGGACQSSGMCRCNTGYDGESCQFGPGCFVDCNAQGYAANSSCNSCICLSTLSGPDCKQCNLTCQNGGINSNCECKCPLAPTPWGGSQCEIPLAVAQITLIAPVTFPIRSQPPLHPDHERFIDLVLTDISSSINVPKSLIAFRNFDSDNQTFQFDFQGVNGSNPSAPLRLFIETYKNPNSKLRSGEAGSKFSYDLELRYNAAIGNCPWNSSYVPANAVPGNCTMLFLLAGESCAMACNTNYDGPVTIMCDSTGQTNASSAYCKSTIKKVSWLDDAKARASSGDPLFWGPVGAAIVLIVFGTLIYCFAKDPNRNATWHKSSSRVAAGDNGGLEMNAMEDDGAASSPAPTTEDEPAS